MAKKRLNKHVVVALALCGFVMMILASVLMLRHIAQRDPKYFVEFAERLETDERWAEAAVFYSKAWERTHEPTYLVRQGEMFLSAGDIPRAVSCWRNALVSQPDLIEAHIPLVNLYVEFARLDGRVREWLSVQEAAQAMLTAGARDELLAPAERAEADALAHHALGLALVHLVGQDEAYAEEGLSELQTAVDLAPEVIDFAVDLAERLGRQGRSDEAEQVYQELLAQHSSPGADASKTRLVYAKHLAGRAHRAYEEAERYFRESLALGEGDLAALVEAKLGYAVFLTQQWARAAADEAGGGTTGRETDPKTEELFTQAETTLRQCIESDPETFDAYVGLATLYGAARRWVDVVDVCESRLSRALTRKGIEERRSQLSMFRLYIFASQACVSLGLAGEDSARAEPTPGSGAGGSVSRAAWFDKADTYVTDALGEYPSHPRALSQSGRVKLARGQDRAALQDLRAADDAYRAYNAIDWENKLLLARLHLRLDEPGAAKAVLDEVRGLWSPPSPGTLGSSTGRKAGPTEKAFWTLYAKVLFLCDEFNRALRICDRILGMAPDNADLRQLKAAIYERQEKAERAREVFEPLPGSDVVSAILRARALKQEGDTAGALEVLLAALEKAPTDIRLLREAASELLNLDRAEEAKRIVEQALAVDPKAPELRQLAALVDPSLSNAQRKKDMLAIIEDEADMYKRSLALIDFHVREQDLSAAAQWVDVALRHLAAKDTPFAAKATLAHHRALLRTKLRVAAKLCGPVLDSPKRAKPHVATRHPPPSGVRRVKDQPSAPCAAMSEARDEAAAYNVDGAGGKTVLGLYHELRGETDLAIKALQEALEAQPTDADALAHLGWSLQVAGRVDDADVYLKRAIRVNPHEALAHKGLAAVAQRRGDADAYEQALETCKRLIPNDAWVQAEVLAQKERSDPGAAIARREAELAEVPDDYANLRRLAALCEAAGDHAKAERYHQRLLDLRPDDLDTVRLASEYFRRNGQPDKGLELLARFATTRPTLDEQAKAQIVLAAHHLNVASSLVGEEKENHHQEAEAALLKAADLAETLDVTHSLAEFYMFRKDQPREALPWLEKAAKGAEEAGSPRLSRILAQRIACVLHRRIDDTQAARRYVDEFLSALPDDPIGLYWDSEVHGRTGHLDEAVKSLDAYLLQRPQDSRALYARAQRFVQLGRPARAIEDLEAIKRAQPRALARAKTLKPRLLLALLHKQAGRKDAWIRELEALADDAPENDPTANEALAEAYLEQARLVDAQRIVTGQINLAGDTPDARWFFLRGRIALEQGDPDGALQAFDRAAQVNGYGGDSLTRVLGLCLNLKRYGRGIEYYQQHALKSEPSTEVLSRHALLLAMSGETSEAVEQFRLAMGLDADESSGLRSQTGASARRTVTRDLQAAFPLEEAITLFERDAPEGNGARANDRILIRLYRLADRADRADALLEGLIRTAPNDRRRADLLYERGEMYQLAGESARARRAYEEALRNDEDNWATLNNLAYLLSDDLGEYDLALPLAKRAAAINDTATALDTLGWIYVGLVQYDRAIADLSRAIRLDGDMAAAYLHLGEAYRRDSQFRLARDILEQGMRVVREGNNAAAQALIEESLEKANDDDSTP